MKKKKSGYLLYSIALFGILITGCQKNDRSSMSMGEVSTHRIDSSLYTVSGLGGQNAGQILIAENTHSSSDGFLAILDEKGYLIKEKEIGSRADDFQKWTIDGKTRYSYLLAEGDYATGGSGTEEGYDIICDSNLTELSRAKFLSAENQDIPNNDRLDVHDFILLGDNHYMAISDQIESPKNIPGSLHPAAKARVVACIIQEVNNGQVVFQWDATDFPEFYSSSVENNDFSDSVNTIDYMHMNSICIDPNDNNIICSFRNLDQIIKINRISGVIMWRLGGRNSDFPLTPEETFLRQHYVRFTDNNQTLMFLDNGLATVRPYSRILEFHLDENGKTISNFKAFKIPDKFIQYAGSVKKENGSYFIGGGSANYALQVNYTSGEVYLRLNQLYPSYRALKY